MLYVGMDVSSKSFVTHVINEKKKVVFKGEVAPSREGLRALTGTLGAEKKLVVFEAGNQMKWIALTLKKMEGVEIHVVHPNEIKWINQSNGKTDKVDAKKLAELARADMLPRKVHIVEGKVRELRELTSARTQLMQKRVALINTIWGYAKQEGHRLPSGFYTRDDWREQLAKTKFSATMRAVIESFKEGIEGLQKSEAALSAKIVAIKDERLERLESIPSIGKLTSRTLLGALDDASRFDDKKAAAKYGALTPTLYQSGDVTHLGHVNRNGRHEVRRVLLQCAHTCARMRSAGAVPLREFYERLCRKRGKKIAIVALARKLLTIAYGVLKHGTYYDPAVLSAARA
jgi:transposase